MNTQQLLEKIKRQQKALQNAEVQLKTEWQYLEERLADALGDEAGNYRISKPKELSNLLSRLEEQKKQVSDALATAKQELEELWAKLEASQADES